MSNLYSELVYIECVISNTCDAMTNEGLTEARRRELSLKLDNLNSKRDYIQSKIDILEGEAENEPDSSKELQYIHLKMLILFGVVAVACFYFYLSLVIR